MRSTGSGSARRRPTGSRSSTIPTSTSSTSRRPNMLHERAGDRCRRGRQGRVLREAGRWHAGADGAGRGRGPPGRRDHRCRIQLPLGAARAARQAPDRQRPTGRDHQLSRPVLLDVRRRPDGSAVVALQHRRGRLRRVVRHPVATPSTWPRCSSARSRRCPARWRRSSRNARCPKPAAPTTTAGRPATRRARSPTRTTPPRWCGSRAAPVARSSRRARSSAPSRRWRSTSTARRVRCGGTSRR